MAHDRASRQRPPGCLSVVPPRASSSESVGSGTMHCASCDAVTEQGATPGLVAAGRCVRWPSHRHLSATAQVPPHLDDCPPWDGGEPCPRPVARWVGDRGRICRAYDLRRLSPRDPLTGCGEERGSVQLAHEVVGILDVPRPPLQSPLRDMARAAERMGGVSRHAMPGGEYPAPGCHPRGVSAG